ncbi:MAG: flavodoxin [Deltaproteobacteria bacterium]|nr:flavodoxin [Deltaproteobacteria bacterium]
MKRMATRLSGVRVCSSRFGAGPGALPDRPKALVAYFSYGGSTARLAETVAQKASADLSELRPAVPYPLEEGRVSELARAEGRDGALPELGDGFPDPSGYGAVLVGSPVWWFGLAGPVRSWLAKFDFSGKPVALFVTHGGGGPSKCLADLARLAKGASVEPGVLAVKGNGSGGLDGLDEAKILSWLRGVRAPGGGPAGYLGL